MAQLGPPWRNFVLPDMLIAIGTNPSQNQKSNFLANALNNISTLNNHLSNLTI